MPSGASPENANQMTANDGTPLNRKHTQGGGFWERNALPMERPGFEPACARGTRPGALSLSPSLSPSLSLSLCLALSLSLSLSLSFSLSRSISLALSPSFSLALSLSDSLSLSLSRPGAPDVT